MKRLWEKAVRSRGPKRLYYSPILAAAGIVTPIYQYFSEKKLRKRANSCSGGWQAKVFSIGNITVGGSGKTPIVEYLARQFIIRGNKVAIVHSGYGRRDNNDVVIDSGCGRDYSVEQVGDEVSMLARHVPEAGFAVGGDKKKMTSLADRQLHPDIILIDDGYQRLDIEKDIDIVVVDRQLVSDESRGNPSLRLFPAGILRESQSSLSRADAIFISSGMDEKDFNPGIIRQYNPRSPIIYWRMAIAGVESGGKQLGIDVLYNKRPFLFAGIGSFPRLLSMLSDLGIKPVGAENLGDHFQYKKSDFERLSRVSSSINAGCYLTTAKDVVKLPPEGLDKPVYCLNLVVRPESGAGLRDIFGWEDR